MLAEPSRLPEAWLAELPQTVRGLFLSDLHAFSPRSTARQIYTNSSEEPSPDLIVLGGDIFDFRWSHFPSVSQSIDQAITWIEELLAQTHPARVLFLPGNHDCLLSFLSRVHALATANPRLAWMPHHARIGDTLFLHGDILDAGGHLEDLAAYRAKFQHEKKMPKALHLAYDALVSMRIHKLVPWLRHRPDATCQRLSKFIKNQYPEDYHTIRTVYFGHTHVPIPGTQVGQTVFYNPGAQLRHMQFTPQHFEFQKS